jgi:hypothetical protein
MEDQNVPNEGSTDQDNIHAAIRNGLTSFRDAFHVTCRSTNQPHNQCGQCKACLVDSRIHTAKDWWLQTGDLMRRRFLLALINRLKRDILDHLAQILQPFVNAKGLVVVFLLFFSKFSNLISIDYTYTRNKFDAGTRGTMDNMSMKENTDPIKRQDEATKLIVWFNHEDKYSQGSFILSILQWCESYLIYTIALNIFSIQDIDCK